MRSDPAADAVRSVRRALQTIEIVRRVEPGATYVFEAVYSRVSVEIETAADTVRRDHGEKVALGVKYALVAHADEVAQREPGPLRDFWKPLSLQRRIFDENRAGDGFFERLDDLLRERPGAGRDLALHVYALCLYLGFVGRYEHDKHGGERALRQHRDVVFVEVEKRLREQVWPMWLLVERSGERRPAPRLHALPAWWLIAAIAAVIVFFTEARCTLGSMTEEVTRRAESPPSLAS